LRKDVDTREYSAIISVDVGITDAYYIADGHAIERE